MKIENIKKNYGKKEILKDVSFEAEQGSCVGILGINGSGKSTLLSILAGVQTADCGSFIFKGADLLKDSKALSSVVGYVPQGTPLIEELTARDNLLLWYAKTQLDYELNSGVLSLLGISEFLNKRVSRLSGGMKKRLSIGCSMAGHPEILIMDEPTAALDLVCKRDIADYLSLFKNSGGTVIFSTHDMAEIDLCDKVYILKNGMLREYNGNIDEVVDNLR